MGCRSRPRGHDGVDPNIYIAYAVSKAKTGSANHIFYLVKNDDGIAYRVCTPAKAGACPAGNVW